MIALCLLALLHSEVIVSGESLCPSAAAVSAALAESVTDARSEGQLHVSTARSGVALTFTDSLGQTRTRLLPPQGNCEEQAVRASVVVATWLAAPESVALPPIDVHLKAPPVLAQEDPATWRLGLGPSSAQTAPV